MAAVLPKYISLGNLSTETNLDIQSEAGARRTGSLKASLLSHKAQIAAIAAGAALLCLAGLAYAVAIGDASDGGRGGALTVALSFAAFFTASNTPIELIEARGLDGECHFDDLSYKERVTRLKGAIAILEDRHNAESLSLAITTFVGTIFWGFGDLFAAALGASPV